MDQLFPFGSRQTVEMLVFWATQRLSNAPLDLLTTMLTVVRPRIYPELTVQPVHERLVYVIAQMLSGDLRAVPERWEGPPPIPRARIPREMQGKALETAATFLNILERGPDSEANDGVPLTVGYEHVFYRAICKAARELPKDHDGFPILVGHAVELCPKVGLQYTDLDEVFVEFFKDNLAHTSMTMVNFFFTHLRRLATRRSCSGPGCTRKMLDDDAEAPFPWCARCKLARYCSRGCQKADWRAVLHPHKHICELLYRIRATGADPQEEHEKHRTTFHDAGLSNNEQLDLMSWAVSATMDPKAQPQMQAQLCRMRGPSMHSIDIEGLSSRDARMAIQSHCPGVPRAD
ncbi:hypothetical protein AURDEDRAFT_168764 [Auricularia subglabra TFB-10046 SS5]|nr:hypothetical protein AURDEDRAFT_168764 [Auricularia subglabra TFB-10046 SS5]